MDQRARGRGAVLPKRGGTRSGDRAPTEGDRAPTGGDRAPTGRYGWALLRRDALAGLTVAAVAVPQAMAYALLAGVSPVIGLYTAIVMAALGSLFGSSTHLINGPTNAISLVVFGLVAGVGAGPDDPGRVGLVALLAVLAGLIQVALSLLKLGGLARYVPEAVVLGFVTGAGLLMALTQIPTALGLREAGTSEDHLLYRLWLTCSRGGPDVGRSLAICLGTVLLIAGLRRLGGRLGVKLPEMLLSLVLVSALVGLVGPGPAEGAVSRLHVEGGLPTPRLPAWRADWADQLAGIGEGALAVALLGLVEALAMARALAAQTGQPLDYNRQCLAEGLANLGGGLCGCLPGSGSLSRSAVNYHAGAATRLSGVFSAAAVAAALWLFAPLADFVPPPALAGVLLWAAWRIVDPRRLRERLRASRSDTVIALSTAFAAIFIRVELAVLVGLLSSWLCRALGGCARARRQAARPAWLPRTVARETALI
jgi:sulfate permease, SulP family